MLNNFENPLDLTDYKYSFPQICSIEHLYRAWRKVRANGGAGGIDAVSLKNFEKNLENNLQELSRNLLNRSYQPLPVKFVQVVKANGKMRELGILAVRDRIAQRAVLDAVEPQFDSLMKDCNFAFRAGRNLEMAIQQILLSRANGFWWTVEADIKDYFGSINREILLRDVGRVVEDEKVLHLIDLWLNAGILEETWWQAGNKKIAHAYTLAYEAIAEGLDNLVAQRYGAVDDLAGFPMEFNESSELSPFEEEKLKSKRGREALKKLMQDGFWLALSHRTLLARILGAKLLGLGGLAIAGLAITPALVETYRQRFHPRKGILQGSPMSPVLANLYLTDFDEKFIQSSAQLVRYCDDFVILCRTQAEAQKALQRAEGELARRNLKLHPEKTRILSPADEFEFLGYRFLSNGTIEPPPTATSDMAEKLKDMSKKIAVRFRRQNKRFKEKKIKMKTWKGFFNFFGPRE